MIEKMIALFVFLFFIPQFLWAKVHYVSRNVSTVVDLQDNDEIKFIDFPNDWAYSRIVLGVNSVPSLQLSGFLVANDCAHDLRGDYDEFAFAYTGEDKVVYHGPAQNLPVHWWVDASPVLSECRHYSEMTRNDSIQALLYGLSEFIYSDEIKDYIDLGDLNSETQFEGTSSKFKIVKLPDWFYNQIFVLVESLDGRELNGYAFAGGTKAKVNGFSAKFAINQKTSLAPAFELAFPESRKVRLKWWAEVGVPREAKVDAKEKMLTSDSVEVEYTFSDNLGAENSVKIVYDKRKFVDGKVPVIKKLSFNPHGPDKMKKIVKRGSVYEIDADLNAGDSVVVAVPLDFEYQADKDSVLIRRFNEDTNEWAEEPVDSVVGNYAYFKPRLARSCSWSDYLLPARAVYCGVKKTKDVVEVITDDILSGDAPALFVALTRELEIIGGVGGAEPTHLACLAIESCRNGLVEILKESGKITEEKLKDAISDAISLNEDLFQGVNWAYNKLRLMTCFDTKTKKSIYGSAKRSDWDVEQGNVNIASLLKDDVVSHIVEKKYEKLQKLSDPYDPVECEDSKMEQCKWERTKNNLDILLANAVIAKFGTLLPKTFSKLLSKVSERAYDFEVQEDGKARLIDKSNPHQLPVPTINKNGMISIKYITYYDNYDFDDYFMTQSGLVEEAAKFVSGVRKCYPSVNITGQYVQKYIDALDGVKDFSYSEVCNAIFDFVTLDYQIASDHIECADFLTSSDMSILDGHEGKLIAISEALARVSLLAWLEKSNDFRDYSLLRYKVAYDGVLAWLELAAPLLDYNNIVIKAHGSLALFEYIHYGTDYNLGMLNASLNRHYGENGGFSEGTGYSLYIWDDVPYILAALKDAYKAQGESEQFHINEKFLNSPDYMFEFSRPVGVAVGSDGEPKHYGLIPVEIDDGVTYNPDYRVWAKLKNDPKYLAINEMYDMDIGKKSNPILAFGYPNANMYSSSEKGLPDRGLLWGDFKDGIGMITAVNKDNDTVALSMIAESGLLWTRGQSHDQQDNLSITLTSSKKGFLIQDPGYSGFNKRSVTDKFHRYVDHNVLTNDEGQDDNRTIPASNLISRVSDFSGDFPGIEVNYFVNLFEGIAKIQPKDYSLTVEGGSSAKILNEINEPVFYDGNEVQKGIIGYTAKTPVGTVSSVENHRSIMYFGENFWVIDRPNKLGLKWHVNSPIESWGKLEDAGVRLYNDGYRGSLVTRVPENDSDVDAAKIYQNGSRSDYDNRYLKNYSYTAFGGTTAQEYVMTYSLGNESFTRCSDYTSLNLFDLCFENKTGTKRVVIPHNISSSYFSLCSYLPKGECFGDASSTGITMFVKTSDNKWTTRWVLDGELYVYDKETNTKIRLKSATMDRLNYVYEKADGSSMFGQFEGPYLPAIPILLLR